MKKFVDSVLEMEQAEENSRHNYSAGSNCSTESGHEIVSGLYSEYKQCFESRNMGRVFSIIQAMEETKADSPLLHLMRGEVYLYAGDGDRSFDELLNYVINAHSVDSYAMSVIALWNQAAGHAYEALTQHCEALDGAIEPRQRVWILLNAIRNKKRMRFLDTSMEYYRRLMALPEGYALMPYLLLEVIHLHILKKNYDEARNEIMWYSQHGLNVFLLRLTVYLDYSCENYEEILSRRDEPSLDPYVAYIIGRIAAEQSMSDIDPEIFFAKAFRRGKDNPFIYVTLGNYFYKRNDLQAAIDNYDKALKIDPNIKHALVNKEIAEAMKDSPVKIEVSDIVPDVEILGFFYTHELFGYATFRVNREVPKKLTTLKHIYSISY